jgi:hypothetical protein
MIQSPLDVAITQAGRWRNPYRKVLTGPHLSMRYRSQRSAWLGALREIVHAIGPTIRSQALRDGAPSIDDAAVLFQWYCFLPADLLVFHNIHSSEKKEKRTKKERTAAVAPQALQPAQSNYKGRQKIAAAVRPWYGRIEISKV